jgi:hypothetical protein
VSIARLLVQMLRHGCDGSWRRRWLGSERPRSRVRAEAHGGSLGWAAKRARWEQGAGQEVGEGRWLLRGPSEALLLGQWWERGAGDAGPREGGANLAT